MEQQGSRIRILDPGEVVLIEDENVPVSSLRFAHQVELFPPETLGVRRKAYDGEMIAPAMLPNPKFVAPVEPATDTSEKGTYDPWSRR